MEKLEQKCRLATQKITNYNFFLSVLLNLSENLCLLANCYNSFFNELLVRTQVVYVLVSDKNISLFLSLIIFCVLM